MIAPVGKGAANYWGIRDLHGLVWEWVEDFQATLVAEDDRSKGSPERSRFCGGTGAQAVDPGAYATFMRVAQRSALEARYTTAQLGFRCARDANGGGR